MLKQGELMLPNITAKVQAGQIHTYTKNTAQTSRPKHIADGKSMRVIDSSLICLFTLSNKRNSENLAICQIFATV